MSNIAFVPARKGSKGIPNKNIIPLCGRPLIEYTVELAVNTECIDYVVVSSDSDVILKISEKFGKKVIPVLRPDYLATDISSTEDALKHALDELLKFNIQPEFIVLLQPTSPLRKIQHIEECMSIVSATKSGSLLSVSKPIQHPSDFIASNSNGFEYIYREGAEVRRQDFKEAMFINGSIYITRYNEFVNSGKIYSLDDCNVYAMPIEYSVDIDTPFDLMLCDAVMKNIKELHNEI